MRSANTLIKRRTRVVAHFCEEDAIERLVGGLLLALVAYWQLEGRRMVSAERMAAIPLMEDLPAPPGRPPAPNWKKPGST